MFLTMDFCSRNLLEPGVCLRYVLSLSKCASLSSHRVSLALYVSFDLFLFMSGFSAWWSVSISIGCPYIWSLNCSSPHTTASRSSSLIAYFFSVSDRNLLGYQTGFKWPSFCRCLSVALNTFVLAFQYSNFFNRVGMPIYPIPIVLFR